MKPAFVQKLTKKKHKTALVVIGLYPQEAKSLLTDIDIYITTISFMLFVRKCFSKVHRDIDPLLMHMFS